MNSIDLAAIEARAAEYAQACESLALVIDDDHIAATGEHDAAFARRDDAAQASAADVLALLADARAHRTRADAAEAEVARLRAAREVVLPLHRDHLREQRDTARAEVAALRAQVEALQEAAVSDAAMISALSDGREQLRADLALVECERAALISERDSLRAQVEAMQTEADATHRNHCDLFDAGGRARNELRAENAALRAIVEGRGGGALYAEHLALVDRKFTGEFSGADEARLVKVRADIDRMEALQRIDVLSAEADALRAQVEALQEATASDAAMVWALGEARERLLCEVAALRAIVEGRAEAPTDAEIAAHAAAGGRWLVALVPLRSGVTPCEVVRLDRRSPIADAVARWWPLDATGRPTTWPTTGGGL